MNWTRLASTPHGRAIVSVEAVKRHLHILHDDEDEYLTDLALVATAMIDGPDGIGVSTAPATYVLSLDALERAIPLPVFPARSIVSVTLSGQQIDPEGYRLENGRDPAVLYFEGARTTDRPDAVKITFEAGWDEPPADLRHAALMIVGHLYRHREASSEFNLSEVPMAVASILARYRR